MALRQTKKISELPALSPASLDTTFVVGISGSTTYKISINNLTSSLDTTFATDLVTNTLSNTLDTKLSTSSFNSYTASISTGSLITSILNLNTFTASVTTASIVTSISNLNTFTASVSTASLVTSISNLNTFTASQSTSSLVNRLNAIESVSGSWITESETGSFLTSLSGAISSSSQLTSSYDTRYTLSGSVQPLPSNLLSSSAQITAFGFISSSTTIDTGSLVTTSSFTTLSSSVDSRLDTLEASIITGSVNYVQKLGSRVTGVTSTGVTIISENITTTGNPVQIMVTGDANPVNVTSWTRLQIYRDENAIGGIVQVENSSNLNVPYCVNVIDTPPAGTYSYSMRTVSGISGLFDFGESTGPVLTAVELNSKTSFPSGTISGSSQLTSSFDTRYLNTGGDGVISGSSQLTSSFDTRYAISASFVSSSNLSSIQTITSASYAALTPVSGTLYIIIG